MLTLIANKLYHRNPYIDKDKQTKSFLPALVQNDSKQTLPLCIYNFFKFMENLLEVKVL